eukprot:COSAG05_NODE_859_length_6903_cov_24.371399_6_plen_57_part_00
MDERVFPKALEKERQRQRGGDCQHRKPTREHEVKITATTVATEAATAEDGAHKEPP